MVMGLIHASAQLVTWDQMYMSVARTCCGPDAENFSAILVLEAGILVGTVK